MDTTTANPSAQVPPPVTQTASMPAPQQFNTPSEPTAPEPTPPPTPAAEKKLLPKIILIIVLIGILGLGVNFVLSKNKSLPKNSQKTGEATHSTQPKPQQPGLTKYTNKENKFTLQYPEELKVTEKNVGLGVSTIELRSEDNLNEEYAADIQMMTIPKYLAKAVGQDFDEYYNMNDGTSKTITAEDQSRTITKVKNRTINNNRAFEFKSAEESGVENENMTIGVYIELGDKIIIISTQEDNRADLEDMLANFSYTP